MDKAARPTSPPPTSIVPRRSPRNYRRARFQVRHGVTGVPQVRHASVSRSLRRSYPVGAATDAAIVSGLVDGGSAEVRSAVRKKCCTVRRATRRDPWCQSSPSKAAGRSGALRVRGAVVPCSSQV